MGFLEIAATIASIGYTAYKLWYIIQATSINREAKLYATILRIVDAAVQSVYTDFVRVQKNADGEKRKLSDDERSQARIEAYGRVLRGLRDHNIKADILPPDELMNLIEDSVCEKQTLRRNVK